MKKTILLLLVLFLPLSFISYAQTIEEWTTYTSVRTINDLTVDTDDVVWGITTGGVLSTDLNGEITNYTTKEGLSRMDGTVIIHDPSENQIIIGYINGVLDVIDINSGEIFSLNDIKRNQNFTSKSINDFSIHHNNLYVATDFGIVVYNLENLFVNDSFVQVGSFTRGISVSDIFIENDSLYTVTAEGLGAGSLNDELSINTNWKTIDAEESVIEGEFTTVGVKDTTVFIATTEGNYVRESNGWNTYDGFGSALIDEFIKNEDSFAAYSQTSIYLFDTENTTFNRTRPDITNLTLQTVRIKGNSIYIGTANNGIGVTDLVSGETELIEAGGPYQNYFSDIKFDGKRMIVASTNESARNPDIDNAKGYYIYDFENWSNFNQNTNETINSFGFQQTFSTAISEDYYYFGSWGRGVARHAKEDNSIHIFDETNSTLRGWVDDSDQFPVISGLESDSNDDVWLISRYGDTPLYYQTPGDENWVPLPKASAASNSDEYVGLFIDSYDKKWITLENTSTAGNGLIILDTGTDPSNTSDDNSVKLTSGNNNGNLPDNKVNAIIEDNEGEIWIGTGRGIARFIFPELIVEGGPAEREAQWLINEDTTASSRFLLRDVNVSAMAVNSANQKWIGSVNQGIWVLNAEGSQILKRFTAENSPLYSNNIKSIAVNEATGEVFIATDVGLISYQDIPKKPVQEMDELKVFPNPFSYNQNSRIVIEGLSEETNVKIVGVDGTVFQELDARGGRIEWDGLNYNGNQLGSGVYFVVAFEGNSRQTGMGKVVIVR